MFKENNTNVTFLLDDQTNVSSKIKNKNDDNLAICYSVTFWLNIVLENRNS